MWSLGPTLKDGNNQAEKKKIFILLFVKVEMFKSYTHSFYDYYFD